MASSVVDVDPDGDSDGGQASLSFEQYDIFVPQQRLETFDITQRFDNFVNYFLTL